MAAKAASGFGVAGLVKLAVLGGGAYWIYKSYMDYSSSSPTSGFKPLVIGKEPNIPTAPAGSTPGTPAQTQNIADLLSSITAGMTEFSGGATYDEWNWARGQFQSAPQGIEDIFPGMDRATKMSLDEYMAGLRSKGLASVGGGLGQILNMGAFFAQSGRQVFRGNFR